MQCPLAYYDKGLVKKYPIGSVKMCKVFTYRKLFNIAWVGLLQKGKKLVETFANIISNVIKYFSIKVFNKLTSLLLPRQTWTL